MKLLLNGCDVIFECLYLAVSYFSHTTVVALTFRTLCLNLEVFYLLLVLLYLVYKSTLAFPFRTILALLVAQLCYLLVELGEF